MNIFEPSSYVQKVKVQYEHKQIVDYDQEFRNRAPNFKHKDGKIYASRPGEPYWVCPVSPFHPKFRTQIEDGVWPLVEALITKNYMTIASCEGHEYDEKMYVALIFIEEENAKNFIEECSIVDGWNFRIENKYRDMWVSERLNDKVVYTEKKKIPLEELKEVFKQYNKLFFKNSEKYVYVDMELLKYPSTNALIRIINRYILKKVDKNFIKQKNEMINFIKNKLSINKE